MKRFVLAFVISMLVTVLTFGAVSRPKKQYLKTVKVDTSTLIVKDTLSVLRYDTVKVVNTYKDTVKLISSDTTKSIKYDTLKIKRK